MCVFLCVFVCVLFHFVGGTRNVLHYLDVLYLEEMSVPATEGYVCSGRISTGKPKKVIRALNSKNTQKTQWNQASIQHQCTYIAYTHRYWGFSTFSGWCGSCGCKLVVRCCQLFGFPQRVCPFTSVVHCTYANSGGPKRRICSPYTTEKRMNIYYCKEEHCCRNAV